MLALTPYGRKCMDHFEGEFTDRHNGVYIENIRTPYELAGFFLFTVEPYERTDAERRIFNECGNNENALVKKKEIVGHITFKEFKKELDKCYITDMELLAILENYRIATKSLNSDYTVRLCSSFIAQFFGYDNRKDWTGILSSQKLVDYTASSEEARKKYKELAEKLGYKSSN